MYLVRTAIPMLALLAGVWVGFGHPGSAKLVEQGRRALRVVAPAKMVDRVLPPPVETAPAAVDIDAPASHPPSKDLPRLNPEDRVERAWLLAEGPAHAPGDARRLVTLTFDDGPSPETTPRILDLLDIHHLHASFFFIGRYLDGDDARAEQAREIARRAALAGHVIGNHTHDHKHLTEAPRAAALAQIDDGAASIARVTGQSPTFFRPPYGDLSRFLERTLAKRGTEIVLWSAEGEDMTRDDPDAIADALKMRLDYAGGGIVLLHDVKPSSVHAFAKLLHWLNENRWDPARPDVPGYDIVDLYDYIRETAAHPQPYASRTQLEEARKAAWLEAHRGAATPSPPPAPASLAKRADVVL